MFRSSHLLLAVLLLGSACTSTNNSSETATANGRPAAPGNSPSRPPGEGSEVLGAYDPGTADNTPATTAAALQGFSDAEFLLATASSNQLEIQLGQLAAQQAGSAEVKQFGQMMVDHHTAAIQEMNTLASQLGVTPSAAIMPMHQQLIDRLQGKTGRAFDERYMDVMETAHKLDIVMFEAKSKQAETPAVQAFASKTLPMLRTHLAGADALEKQVD